MSVLSSSALSLSLQSFPHYVVTLILSYSLTPLTLDTLCLFHTLLCLYYVSLILFCSLTLFTIFPSLRCNSYSLLLSHSSNSRHTPSLSHTSLLILCQSYPLLLSHSLYTLSFTTLSLLFSPTLSLL